jgi:hypothetical protein
MNIQTIFLRTFRFLRAQFGIYPRAHDLAFLERLGLYAGLEAREISENLLDAPFA